MFLMVEARSQNSGAAVLVMMMVPDGRWYFDGTHASWWLLQVQSQNGIWKWMTLLRQWLSSDQNISHHVMCWKIIVLKLLIMKESDEPSKNILFTKFEDNYSSPQSSFSLFSHDAKHGGMYKAKEVCLEKIEWRAGWQRSQWSQYCECEQSVLKTNLHQSVSQGPATLHTSWSTNIIDLLLMIAADQTSTRDKLQISYCQIFHWNIPHLVCHSHIPTLSVWPSNNNYIFHYISHNISSQHHSCSTLEIFSLF